MYIDTLIKKLTELKKQGIDRVFVKQGFSRDVADITGVDVDRNSDGVIIHGGSIPR